jgi:hypothetical protein
MSDTTLDVTDVLGTAIKYLKLKDNGDGTYSIASADPTGLVNAAYDSVVINYTDATKATISTVVFKLGVTTVCTLTQTVAATSDTWTRS